MLKNYILNYQTLYILEEKKMNFGIVFVIKPLIVASNKKNAPYAYFVKSNLKKN